MIGKIIKITDDLLNSSEGEKLRSYSHNLPLFSTNLNFISQELSQYVLQFWQVNHGYRYPVWISFINEDDFKKINAYWDWVVDEGLDEFEFLL